MKRKLLFIILLMVLITAVAAVFIAITKDSASDKEGAEEAKLKLVSTFYPVYLIGLNLFDNINEVEVKSLTDLDTGCLHDYQLTSQDMKNISEADILVINGGGMEAFLQDIKANYPDLTIIDASKDIELYQDNSHVWLDPDLYIRQIENVRDAIISYLDLNSSKATGSKKLDASKIKERLTENADAYIRRIEEIDLRLDEIKEKYLAAGKNSAKAVIFHDAFAYIAKRIGMPVAYSIPLDHDTSLSAEEIAAIIDDVNNDEISYLFTEEQYSDSVAKRIEAETSAKAYIIDSAVTGNGSKESYIEAMEKNIKVLESALFNQG
ncbi:MAG: zinc ABC transporter substrate-binding protein [Clostridiales bacterium]|nr:zinc ABC transporter substrate-binding protein [Clostridiales bacterium]